MPYIPEKHANLGLLPKSTKESLEVIFYPNELIERINQLLQPSNQNQETESDQTLFLVPIKKDSLVRYQAEIDEYLTRYKKEEVADFLKLLKLEIRQMNIKENWSVVRFTGHQFENDTYPLLTRGACYYWPCSRENPEYLGVIDNGESTANLYPSTPSDWEIVDDPTGMAARALAGNANTIESWDVSEYAPEFVDFMRETGLRPNLQTDTDMPMHYTDFPWNNSENDETSFTCPACNATQALTIQTLLNTFDTPDAAEKLTAGTFFDVTCIKCGSKLSLPHPCLYLDPLHGVSMYLVANNEMYNNVAAMFTEMLQNENARHIRFRIVTDARAFREKALAFDACIDDRSLEMLKFGIRGQASQEGYVTTNNTYEVFLEEVAGDMLRFALYVRNTKKLVEVDRKACELFDNDLAQSSLKDEQPFNVNEAWANTAFEIIEQEQ